MPFAAKGQFLFKHLTCEKVGTPQNHDVRSCPCSAGSICLTSRKGIKHMWKVFVVEQFDNQLFNRPGLGSKRALCGFEATLCVLVWGTTIVFFAPLFWLARGFPYFQFGSEIHLPRSTVANLSIWPGCWGLDRR